MKIRVAVVFGGKSVEHEVSVISALQAVASMDTAKYEIIPVYMTKSGDMYIGSEVGNIEAYKDIPALIKKSEQVVMMGENGVGRLVSYPVKKMFAPKPVEFDMVFPIVHGTNVEDGALQGYIKTLGIPFAGCDVTASAVGMDKFIMKAILKEYNVPVLDGKVYTLADYADMDGMVGDIEKKIGYPVIIKPVNLGSSVGISVAKDRNSLESSLDDAFSYATKVLAEHAILNLREINCSVLGDENEARASECEEPFHGDEILSYKDKYQSGSKKTGGSKGMASVSRKIPADISAQMRDEVRELAVRSFKALGCNGVSRIDFMLDADTGKLYFNEINTIPGSLAFYLWEPIGVSYTKLLDEIIELAFKRQRQEKNISFTFESNILSNAGFKGSKGKL